MVSVLQRTEMVRRIADEIASDIVELGVDGRLVKLQLEELMGGVEDDRRLVILDYFHPESGWHLDQAMTALSEMNTEELLDLKAVGATLHLPGSIVDLEASVQPRGYRLLARIPRLPESVIERSSAGSAPCRRSCGPRSTTSTRSPAWAGPGPGHQGGPVPPGRDQHPRPLHLSRRCPVTS